MKQSISIILATYDESQNIISMIQAISLLLKDYDFEIIVVDDNSPDCTWKLVRDYSKNDNRVKLIHRINTRGLTSAYNDGIKAATKAAVGWLDCDFQHPPEKILELVSKIDQGFEVAIASRFLGDSSGDLRLNYTGKYIIKFHGLLSKFLSSFTSFILGSKLTDWTSGMILVRRDILLKYPLKGDYGEYFMTLIYELERASLKIVEIPYVLKTREEGYSKTSSKGYFGIVQKGVKYLITILKLRFYAK